MYTAKQISEVLETFDRIGSITTVIRQLGYPSRTMLYNWLKTRETGCRTPKENATKPAAATFCTAYPLKYSGSGPACRMYRRAMSPLCRS